MEVDRIEEVIDMPRSNFQYYPIDQLRGSINIQVITIHSIKPGRGLLHEIGGGENPNIVIIMSLFSRSGFWQRTFSRPLIKS